MWYGIFLNLYLWILNFNLIKSLKNPIIKEWKCDFIFIFILSILYLFWFNFGFFFIVKDGLPLFLFKQMSFGFLDTKK